MCIRDRTGFAWYTLSCEASYGGAKVARKVLTALSQVTVRAMSSLVAPGGHGSRIVVCQGAYT
eukprot:5769518-Amphidinium_carterae.1